MTKEEKLNTEEKLCKTDKICFDCHSGVSCFNECCCDINIILTPYDIIRLKNRLGISSDDFLAKYGVMPFTKDQKLPVVFMKLDDSSKKQCQFVTDKGCSVYSDRPWACRMYPIGQATPKGGGTYEDTEFFFLIKDEKCQGHGEKREISIGDYMKDQGVLE